MNQIVEPTLNISELTKRIEQTRRILNFNIPESAWSDYSVDFENDGYEATPGSRLYCSVHVNGVGFHAIAIEVKCDVQGVQVAADEAWEAEFSALYEAFSCDGVLQWIEIASRNYAVFVFPFQR